MSKPQSIKKKKWTPCRWSHTRAVEFCRKLQKFLDKREDRICIGLTGSCLTRGGSKKDCDIILYPKRTSDRISESDVLTILGDYGFDILEHRTPDHPGDDKQVWAYRGPIGRIDFFLMHFE